TSNSSGFDVNDTISPSAQAKSDSDQFTLETMLSNGNVTGDGFTLYSLELANTSSKDITVTLSGTTITGQPVSTSLDVKAGDNGLNPPPGEAPIGFQQFNSVNTPDLLNFFYALQDVTISSSDMASILVNNIVAVDTITNVTASVQGYRGQTTYTI